MNNSPLSYILKSLNNISHYFFYCIIFKRSFGSNYFRQLSLGKILQNEVQTRVVLKCAKKFNHKRRVDFLKNYFLLKNMMLFLVLCYIFLINLFKSVSLVIIEIFNQKNLSKSSLSNTLDNLEILQR